MMASCSCRGSPSGRRGVDENTEQAICSFGLHARDQHLRPADHSAAVAVSDGSVDAKPFVSLRWQRSTALAAGVHRGLSAATGMIIVETIALSTMVCNDP
jgi:hypothetical protein